MKANDVKKELLKSKVMAKFSHYCSGNLYYTVELSDGLYQFPLETVEPSKLNINLNKVNVYDIDVLVLSKDLGVTSFENEIKASFLNRWIEKAIESNEFVKLQ